MKRIFMSILLAVILSIGTTQTAYAHPGRTDKNGGHWDHSTGTYHYHNGGSSGGSSGYGGSGGLGSYSGSGSYSNFSSYTPAATSVPTYSYKIKKKPSSIKIGETYQLDVDNGDETTVFSSSNEKVATIDSKGKITGVSVGTTTIKAETEDTTDSFKLTVKPIEAKTISIGKSFALNVGDSKNLTATVSPNNTTDKTVTYKSDDSKIAIVDKNGKVTGKAKGKTKITATTSNKKSASVTVTVKEVMPSTLQFTSESLRFELKDTHLTNVLTYKMTPDNVTNKEVEFSSADKSVLSISKDGEEVTLLGEGKTTVTITAKANGLSDTIEIEVFAIHPESITIREEQLGITNLFGKKYIKPNTAMWLSAIIEPADATFQDVSWESDNPSAIEIDALSEVPYIKVHATGTATISASVDSVSSELTLVVFDIVSVITLLTFGFIIAILGVLCFVFRRRIKDFIEKSRGKNNNFVDEEKSNNNDLDVVLKSKTNGLVDEVKSKANGFVDKAKSRNKDFVVELKNKAKGVVDEVKRKIENR